MPKISASRREAAARAVMQQDGFEFSGESLVAEAENGSPQALQWVRTADAALNARPTKEIRRAMGEI